MVINRLPQELLDDIADQLFEPASLDRDQSLGSLANRHIDGLIPSHHSALSEDPSRTKAWKKDLSNLSYVNHRFDKAVSPWLFRFLYKPFLKPGLQKLTYISMSDKAKYVRGLSIHSEYYKDMENTGYATACKWSLWWALERLPGLTSLRLDRPGYLEDDEKPTFRDRPHRWQKLSHSLDLPNLTHLDMEVTSSSDVDRLFQPYNNERYQDELSRAGSIPEGFRRMMSRLKYLRLGEAELTTYPLLDNLRGSSIFLLAALATNVERLHLDAGEEDHWPSELVLAAGVRLKHFRWNGPKIDSRLRAMLQMNAKSIGSLGDLSWLFIRTWPRNPGGGLLKTLQMMHELPQLRYVFCSGCARWAIETWYARQGVDESDYRVLDVARENLFAKVNRQRCAVGSPSP